MATYQALYRKYRPAAFSDVVGQSHITRTLQRQVAENRTSHAYLFTGSRGTGKTTCAKILARAVNCENPQDGNPCGTCAACIALEEGNSLDVLELDAASNNGVDQVRALRDEAVYPPANVRKRVYIVDEVHMLSTSAFNALLKILEEPPEHLMFILATTELHKVPATILSRCQRYAFRRISPADIAARLRRVAELEHIPLTDDGAELLARLAEGAMRDGLSLLDQCAASGGTVDSAAVLNTLGLAGHLQTAALLEHILRRDVPSALSLFGELYDNGRDGVTVLRELSALIRDLLLKRMAPEGSAALLSGGYDDSTLARLGALAGDSRLLYLATSLQGVGAELSDSRNSRLNAELYLLRLCDETLSGDLSALVSRVERLEAGHSAAPAQFAAVPAAPPRQQVPPLRQTTPVPPPQATPAPPRQAPPTVSPRQAAPVPDDAPPWDDAPPPPDNMPPWDEPPPSDDTLPPYDESPRVDSVPPQPDSAPLPDTPPQSAPTSADCTAILERSRARLNPMYASFLLQCSGTFADGLFTLYAPDSVTLSRLNNERVEAALLEESGAERVTMREGTPPPVSPQENRAALLTFSRQRPDIIQIIGE
ncbi:MAG: DNA polymerase III subunit gamma/tau [Oscillibacter sp.]|nr:DNA polymerase III subunit gamma/tau [Oscillibacter sp.]